MIIMYWHFNISMIFCTCGCNEPFAWLWTWQLRLTWSASPHRTRCSAPPSMIDIYTVRCPCYDDTMRRALCYLVVIRSLWCMQSDRKPDKFWHSAWEACTMTLSLRYDATAMAARIQNCGCHVAYACGMLYIRANDVGGTRAHMGMHVPTADVT
jgi:hypothetical protein